MCDGTRRVGPEVAIVRSHEEKLRRLSLNDTERVLQQPCVTLDPRTRAMLDVAVLVALNGPSSAFETADQRSPGGRRDGG